MKTIVLVRHSKAVNSTVAIADYYRPLKKKGHVESKEMVQKFIKESLIPDLLISSPATRALETAKIFANELNYPEEKIRYEESLYFDFNGSKFINFMQNCENNCQTVMLFGHEPTFSEFAGFLIDDFAYGFPKTSILTVDFKVDKWNDIGQGLGSKRFFLIPDNKNIDDYKLF